MLITKIGTCLFNHFVFCYLKLRFPFLTVLAKVITFISVLLSIVKLDNRHCCVFPVCSYNRLERRPAP